MHNIAKCLENVFPREIFTMTGFYFTVTKWNGKIPVKIILATNGHIVSGMLALHSKHFYVKYNWT